MERFPGMTPAAIGELTEWQFRVMVRRVDDLNEQAARERDRQRAEAASHGR